LNCLSVVPVYKSHSVIARGWLRRCGVASGICGEECPLRVLSKCGLPR
jgi:hypothetical protein